jgi:hypothetical protein
MRRVGLSGSKVAFRTHIFSGICRLGGKLGWFIAIPQTFLYHGEKENSPLHERQDIVG